MFLYLIPELDGPMNGQDGHKMLYINDCASSDEASLLEAFADEQPLSSTIPSMTTQQFATSTPATAVAAPAASSSSSSSAPAPAPPQEITFPKIEPTPIGNDTNFRAVSSFNFLPGGITQNCDEYIAALSHLKPPPVVSEWSQHSSQQNRIESSATLPTFDQQYTSTDNSSGEDQSLELLTTQMDANTRIHPYQHERWMERYQDLVDYHRANGHCNVPYVYKQNPCLGQWVKRQRHQFKLQKQGHHSNLTQDRIQLLDMLGFIWDSHGAAWDEKFQELKRFHKAHGNCNVPCMYEGNSKLSTWIKRQRRQYRLFLARQPSTMDHERIAKLEGLGLVWDYYGCKNDRQPPKPYP